MRPALFCATQLLVDVSLYDVKYMYLCNTKMSSEHLLSANLTTRKNVLCCQMQKINPAKLTAFTVCTRHFTHIAYASSRLA